MDLTTLFDTLRTKLLGLLPNTALVHNPHTLNPGQSDTGNAFLSDPNGMPQHDRSMPMLTGMFKHPLGAVPLAVDGSGIPGKVVDVGDGRMVALSDRLFGSGTVVPPDPGSLRSSLPPQTSVATHGAAPVFNFDD